MTQTSIKKSTYLPTIVGITIPYLPTIVGITVPKVPLIIMTQTSIKIKKINIFTDDSWDHGPIFTDDSWDHGPIFSDDSWDHGPEGTAYYHDTDQYKNQKNQHIYR